MRSKQSIGLCLTYCLSFLFFNLFDRDLQILNKKTKSVVLDFSIKNIIDNNSEQYEFKLNSFKEFPSKEFLEQIKPFVCFQFSKKENNVNFVEFHLNSYKIE